MVWIYSTRIKPYILPKQIHISRFGYNIFELAGAFFCEGFKARKQNKHRDRFSFSNADWEQIAWFLEASEALLQISKKEWNVQILFPDLKNSKLLIGFWSRLGLSKDKIKLIKNKKVSAKNGVCILNIYSSALAETIYHMMSYLEKESLNSKENALHFFRGLSRGDVGVASKTCITTLSTENEKNDLFFKKICNILYINTNSPSFSRGCWNVSITTYSDFKKIIELDLITHNTRKNRFFKKFVELKGNIPYLYLNAISFGYDTTRKYINLLKKEKKI